MVEGNSLDETVLSCVGVSDALPIFEVPSERVPEVSLEPEEFVPDGDPEGLDEMSDVAGSLSEADVAALHSVAETVGLLSEAEAVGLLSDSDVPLPVADVTVFDSVRVRPMEAVSDSVRVTLMVAVSDSSRVMSMDVGSDSVIVTSMEVGSSGSRSEHQSGPSNVLQRSPMSSIRLSASVYLLPIMSIVASELKLLGIVASTENSVYMPWHSPFSSSTLISLRRGTGEFVWGVLYVIDAKIGWSVTSLRTATVRSKVPEDSRRHDWGFWRIMASCIG